MLYPTTRPQATFPQPRKRATATRFHATATARLNRIKSKPVTRRTGG